MRSVADARRAIGSRFAQPRDRVERRAARVGHIGIGAKVQQHAGQFKVSVHHGHIQRVGAVRRNIIDVRTVPQQRLHGFDVSLAHREQQRRETALRFRVHVRAEFDKLFDRGAVPVGSRPHQRRLGARGIRCIRVRTVFQKKPHDIRVALRRCRHQCRLAVECGFVGVRTGGQQLFDDRCVAVGACEIKRCDVIARSRFGIRPSGDQGVDQLRVIALHRPVERDESVRFRSIDIGMCRDTRANRRHILLFDRIDQTQPCGVQKAGCQ